ncbi:MAG: PSD1 and planctomycete cytochrome C domain-containing protein [Planctomycetia bacterium]
MMLKFRTSFRFCTLWVSMVVCSAAFGQGSVQFNRDIRPILSDSCFQCHGPDEAKRQGGLRLDRSEAAFKGGESGPAIVPGNPDASEILKRIQTSDPDLKMPPAASGKTVSPEQLATLGQWIREGAEYQGHWAFLPVQRPSVPETTPGTSPVDAFLRQRLHKEGLTHSPEASRETLIRRVTLDLTGLPPSMQEVEDFLADQSPDAWERVVDRLLTSPRYGERMAQQWLDFARYADSNGFQVDSSRQMWAWRDWVIAAFNSNQPFDQFTIDQLAGDMRPAPSADQIIATGFNRNTRLNGEGGRIAEEWFAETVIDRVETVGLTWMGLTLNCCRCHDHKYDPISQKEFYQLFAFFNSVDESGVLDSEGGSPGQGNSAPIHRVVMPEHTAEIARLQALVDTAKTHLEHVRQTAADRQVAWETDIVKQLAENPVAWRQLAISRVQSSGGAQFERLDDGSWLASGNNPEFDAYTIESPVAAGPFSGLQLECLPDERLPNKSLGRYSNGNFVLTAVQATIEAPSLKEPLTVSFGRAAADYEQNGYTVAQILAGQGKNAPHRQGWAVDGPTRREVCRAVFALPSSITVPEQATMRITLRHDAIAGHNIGRFRIATSSLPPESLTPAGASFPESVRMALLTSPDQRTDAQKQEITNYFLANGDSETQIASTAVENAAKAVSTFQESLPIVMVMKERNQPRDAHILVRGQYDRVGDKVDRGVPAALSEFPQSLPQNRLGFAQWLVSRNNPLTARVWANRAWERFFGTGIVKTTENLGSQSEWPSHPELLDWLASEFMDPQTIHSIGETPVHAWDIKGLDKVIVMSAAYRQRATVTNAVDPENRLVARGPRFRLAAEVVRDQALAFSDLLVSKIGGPGVRPYMPEGVWDETSRYGDLRGYRADQGDGLYRRSLYTIWKRTAAPPSMQLFDAPSREVCTVKRSLTNTPLQALALLNEVTYVEAARKLAERILSEGGDTDDARLTWGFRLVTSRKPTADELNILIAGLQEDRQRFLEQPEAATKLLATGSATVSTSLPPETLAAWTLTANVLLNLDEVVVR